MSILSLQKVMSGDFARLLLVCSIFLIFISLSGSFMWADENQSRTSLSPEQQKRFEVLISNASVASLTILPVLLGNTPVKRVAQVAGVILERAGMKNLEIGDVEFCPDVKADFQQVVKSFGQFARKNSINTLFLVERLRSQLGLEYYSQKGPVKGRLEKMFAEQTGFPDESEMKAMDNRVQDFKKVAEKTKFMVFPVKILNVVSEEDATHLVILINDSGLLKAVVSAKKPNLEVKRDINEQAVLWSLARTFRDYIREHKPDTDYSVYAQYLFSPKEKTKVLGVHFVVCDRNGEWVTVDFQNKYQSAFKKINPESSHDCNRLVVKRLKRYLD